MLRGQHLIAGEFSRLAPPSFAAVDPTTGTTLEPSYAEATSEEIDRALTAAGRAQRALASGGRELRARLLDDIAGELIALGDALLERAGAETGLPRTRLEMERARTAGQLRLLAAEVREGSYVDARIDRAQPDRAPVPKPDLRRMLIPLGPVTVFGASNFPLAFSVAGGDTAAALAAGCPVVAKAHPNHPGTAELVGGAIAAAVRACGLPAGVFSLLHGRDHAVGLGLVEHPSTRAVAFTGSLAGGRALFDAAAARPDPVPVYAEMGSTNPVFVLPDAMRQRGDELADGLATSVLLGTGQFCTNPGVVIAIDDGATQRFVARLGEHLATAPTGVTLHGGIAAAYAERLALLASLPGVRRLGRDEPPAAARAVPVLLVAAASTFVDHPPLQEETFGPCTTAVLCRDLDQVLELAHRLAGQLTATVHASPGDLDRAGELLAILEQRAGRLLCGGFPTGVEVCPSMQHGGPYPATTDVRSTSVGTAAIGRFLRPICYQSWPPERLPPELRDDNPCGIVRLVDGVRGRA